MGCGPMMKDLHAIARTLGGEVCGRSRVLAPGPGHRPKDRSLLVTFDPDAPEGFKVHSFADDEWTLCRAHVRAVLGLPAWSPRLDRRAVRTTTREPRLASPDEKRQSEWEQARLLEIWEGACNPRNTLVEGFLREERSLHLPDDVAGTVVRFHPACPWKDEQGAIILVPAMIAAMRCIWTDRLKGVLRTRLIPDGKKVMKVKPPRVFGKSNDAAVKLDSDESASLGLVITEGLETALAARQLGFRPVWAVGSAGAIAKFQVLSGIEGLTLAAEEDKTGANARAIAECGNRWHAAGRTVIRLDSVLGGDLNDALMRWV